MTKLVLSFAKELSYDQGTTAGDARKKVQNAQAITKITAPIKMIPCGAVA
jgi:hypothetical protein